MKKAKPLAKIIRESNPQHAPLLSERQMQQLKSASGVILAVIAAGGIMALAVAAPNIFVALGKLHKASRKLGKKHKERMITQRLQYLKRTGKIKMRKTMGEWVISITKAGKMELRNQTFESLAVPKPKKWSHRWWQVAADIPTKTHRAAADALRHKLKTMGFLPLQRTLWYYPYDPRHELQQVIDRFDVSEFVTIMEIYRLDKADEQILTRHFKKQGIL